MENITSIEKSDVDRELDQQREESEARSLINEVERLNTLEGEHLYRWIWELLQNARDEAQTGMEVSCQLTNDQFTFEHNGEPFSTGNLLALTRKTSTKPLDGSRGNAGKFGTGFVTSHLLNKTVIIYGVHHNSRGDRRFELTLDRNSDTLAGMMNSIRKSLQQIRVIDLDPDAQINDRQNRFVYRLGPSAYNIAVGSIRQLVQNLPFTMMVNPKVKSVSIQADTLRKFSAIEEKSAVGSVSFVFFEDGSQDGELRNGIFYKDSGALKIASPATRKNGKYSIIPIGFRAHLFKELPLIGTEEFYLPVIMQHEDFQPTEPRDGVRTKMSDDITDETLDPKAKKNRDAFREFAKAFPAYLSELIEGKVDNLHFLAESGLPPNVDIYYGRDWFQTELQDPIRTALIEQPILRNVEGVNMKIGQAVFFSENTQNIAEFFALVSAYMPERCPDENSYLDWVRIINQQPGSWPQGIMFSVEDLIRESTAENMLLSRFPIEEDRIDWLQQLVVYLETTGKERLAIENELYPNQCGGMKGQNAISHEGDLHPRFKAISEKFGRNLAEELLPNGFAARFVLHFNFKQFLIDLNKQIGDLDVSTASQGQATAILDICCTFRPSRAERREVWYKIITDLLPAYAGSRSEIEIGEEYSFDPAEKWALKYVCSLVQESGSLEVLYDKYFGGDHQTGLVWLNDLIAFIFRNEETRDTGLKFKVLPTRDGTFRVYTEDLYKEMDNMAFDQEIKDIFTDFCGGGNPDAFLIHDGIINSNLREESIQLLTDRIDSLFREQASEEKVKEDGPYKSLFLRLKKWIDENGKGDELFPLFSEKQPVLYIKAFGGRTFGRLLNLTKSADDLEILDKISLSASQVKALDDAVKKIGNAQSLLDKALELADEAESIRWRKDVGNAAEAAFLEALEEFCPDFPEPENPDDGKDFVIRVGGVEYAVEIKSAVEFKETVNMSIKQGRTAVKESGAYALCVISRPAGTLTTKKDFIVNSRFVLTIGEDLKDKIENWEQNLGRMNQMGDLSVKLESQSSSVYVNKPIWEAGISFGQFIDELRSCFSKI
ncbi:hypothetical protein LPB86_15640 [Pedobacter sp. MC2016-14]|uniref:sacsin N-terminal ATP-binding-like domain-containing protein n=1 Tax=Pedobacter sp. MC2016-14 TaxID=2897327 RepID=UPI001E645024|nr:hypothetical protein [Pedobacter sp. MC2016-14]MCD0489674.1 hypothetical protein [Pedobacter sp. MC2016-14]